jgi:hypothetical protein
MLDPTMFTSAITVAATTGQVCLALVFCTAALQKLRHRRVLEGVVANYRILPRALVAPASRSLPIAEMTVGLLLLSGVVPAVAAGAAILLLCAFAWAMAVNLRRGRSDIDCGCHQSFLRQTLRWSLVWRNLVLAALLLPALAPVGADHALWPIGAAAGASLFLLYLLFNTLSSLPQPGPLAA